mmetsp:Transcript_22433/g.88821  ORF Transcript_22433/g.88821 Transcript_22433/m.88821 type:complete len:209 (+) Transcript_22433:202-828(+)
MRMTCTNRPCTLGFLHRMQRGRPRFASASCRSRHIGTNLARLAASDAVLGEPSAHLAWMLHRTGASSCRRRWAPHLHPFEPRTPATAPRLASPQLELGAWLHDLQRWPLQGSRHTEHSCEAKWQHRRLPIRQKYTRRGTERPCLRLRRDGHSLRTPGVLGKQRSLTAAAPGTEKPHRRGQAFSQVPNARGGGKHGRPVPVIGSLWQAP